jgi:hypothetical protein
LPIIGIVKFPESIWQMLCGAIELFDGQPGGSPERGCHARESHADVEDRTRPAQFPGISKESESSDYIGRATETLRQLKRYWCSLEIQAIVPCRNWCWKDPVHLLDSLQSGLNSMNASVSRYCTSFSGMARSITEISFDEFWGVSDNENHHGEADSGISNQVGENVTLQAAPGQ